MLNRLNDPMMNKAVRVIVDMSEDTQIRERARIREKALYDEAIYMGGARAEGEKIGPEKGRAEGKAEAISELTAKLKAMGMSDMDIKKLIKS